MFVGGIVGEMFIPFGLTVVFAMLASLVVALTLIPILSKWLVSSKPKTIMIRDNGYQKIYVRALKWTLGHRAIVVVTAVVLLIGSVGLLAVTGTSFISGSFGEATITINISLPATAYVSDTSAVEAKVETVLSGYAVVRNFDSKIGTSTTSMAGIMSVSQGGWGSNTATITVYLKSDADLQQEISAINQSCQSIVKKGTITVGSDSGVGMGAGFSNSNVNLSIQGQNQEDIASVTAQLMEKLRGVNGIADLKSDLTTVVPKLNIAVDSAKVATSGLPATQMAGLQQEFMLLMNGGTLPGKTVPPAHLTSNCR